MFKKLKNIPVVFQVVQIKPFKPLSEGLSDGPPLLLSAIQSANLSELLVAAFNIAISVGAILAVLRITYAGFIYMTTDVISQKTNSKEVIRNAVIGLLLLLAIVLILERINPEILQFKVDLVGAPSGAAAPQNQPGGLPILP